MSDKIVGRRVLVKTSFWYTISMFLTRGIVFITMPIFTRLLTREEYGNFSVFTSWQSILLIFCSLELYSTLNRARFDYPDEHEFNGYITSCLCLCTLITGIVFAAYMFFPHLFDSFFLLDRKYMLVMFAYLFTVPALNMFQTKQRIEYRYKTSSTISITVAILSPIISLTLVLLLKDKDRLFGRIFGQFFLYILFGIVFYIYFLKRSKKISFAYWKYAIRLGLPLVFSYLGSRILLTADMIVLKHMCTAGEVGILSVSHSTSSIILVLVQTLNLAWSPWFYDMLKINNNEEIRKVYDIYLWAIIAGTAAVLLIGPEIIHVLGGTKYKDSVYLLPPYILCGIFTVLTANFGNLETYYKKPKYSAILTGSVAILNVLLDIIGVKLWGYRAVCYTTVLCQIILILLHYTFTQKMNIKEILPLKTLVLALLTAVAIIPLSLLLYKSNTIRLITVIVCFVSMLVYIIIKKEKIIMLLKKIRKKKEV